MQTVFIETVLERCEGEIEVFAEVALTFDAGEPGSLSVNAGWRPEIIVVTPRDSNEPLAITRGDRDHIEALALEAVS